MNNQVQQEQLTVQNYILAKSDDSKDNQNGQIVGVQAPWKWPVLISSFVIMVAMIVVNYVVGAADGGNAKVSAMYQLWITPPGYFFIIWAVIYTALVITQIYNLVKNVWSLKAQIFFTISNILNLLWTVIFCAQTMAAMYVCFFIILAIGPLLFLVWRELGQIPQENFNIFIYITRNIIAFYLGWIIAATNINFGILLHYSWGASKEAQLIVFWILAPLCAIGVTILNSAVYKLRGFLSCFCLWISVGWAFAGAAITSNGCLNGTISQC